MAEQPGSQTRGGLTRATARRLDAIRALAALYVVFGHAVPDSIFSGFGSEAVITFFLLSGFVIHTNEEGRARSEPLRYLGRRVRRLFPLLILAILVSAVIAGWKAGFGSLGSPANLVQLLGTLTFQQGITGVYQQNYPLWSLSYEAVYYLAYPLLLAVAAPRRLPLVLGVSAVSLLLFAVSPAHYLWVGAYLLIWWAGVEAARLHRAAATRGEYLPVALSLGLLLAIAAVIMVISPQRPPAVFVGRGVEALGAPSMMVRDFSVALLFIGLAVLAPLVLKRAFDRILGPLAVLAPISYGLYVLHAPVLAMTDSRVVRLLVCVPLGFLLAWVGESALRRGGWISGWLAPGWRNHLRSGTSARAVEEKRAPAGA